MDIMQLVDELESLIGKSFRIPFTSNVVVNEDDLYDILDQMRISVPQEVKDAKRTEAERERILARAKEESNRLINMAKEKIMTAVDDHEIIEAAKAHAKDTITRAEQESWQLRVDSSNYVADNLSNLEEHLLKLLTTVRNGLHQIQENQPGSPPPSIETVSEAAQETED